MAENPIDRFYEALASGDVDGIRASFTPDARIWHSFDGLAQTVDESVPAWVQLIAGTTERRAEDVRRQPIDGGYLQQHVFVATTQAGQRTGWPCCIVVRTEGDRIARIEEYIDRAGSYAVPAGQVATPGF